MDWTSYQNSDGTIDLAAAYRQFFIGKSEDIKSHSVAMTFLNNIQSLSPITNQEVAAVALATAYQLAISTGYVQSIETDLHSIKNSAP